MSDQFGRLIVYGQYEFEFYVKQKDDENEEEDILSPFFRSNIAEIENCERDANAYAYVHSCIL